MTLRCLILSSLVGLSLAGCATTASRTVAPAPAAASVSPVVLVDVVLDGQRVSGGQGTWLRPGLVLTTLDTVNDVPPTGELVVRTAAGDFSASLWVGGNPDDANVAFLFVHELRPFGAMAALAPVTVCDELPSRSQLTASTGAPAEQLLADPNLLSGAPLLDPTGCVAALVTAPSGASPALVSLQAIQRVQSGLPAPSP